MSSGSVRTFRSQRTLPTSSTTQTAVSSTETSKPTKCAIAAAPSQMLEVRPIPDPIIVCEGAARSSLEGLGAAAAIHHLYDDMRQGIESNSKGFEAVNSDGALVGPWNPWLHYPKFGGPIWELVKVLSTSPTLPRPVREVAILVTGTHFHSGYELYAHVLIAEARGLPDSKIATIVAGQRP